MNEPNITGQNTATLAASAERFASAAGALEQVLARLEASQDSLHAKIDRIIAAIEDNAARDQQASAQAPQSARKTFSPLVTGLLSKNGVDDPATAVEAGTLDRALATLSLEQRIAVKAELARSGMIA